MQSFRKIVAIKLRAMGDTVLMTAPLAELRRAYPAAEIHAVVTSAWAPLLESHPAVDRIWPYERWSETAARARAIARLALRLRKERFDCAVNFHASPSSALLAFGSGAKTRSVHFHGHRDRNRYSTVTVPGKGTLKPILERDMDVIRALGLHVPAGRSPQIYLQPVELERTVDRLDRQGLHAPLLAIGIGSSRPTKGWPLERYATLGVLWAEQTGGGAVAVTGPGEEELSREFLKLVDDALSVLPDLAQRVAIRSLVSSEGTLSLREVAALTSRCAVFVGNDSGPKHLAVAVGAPTVTLFGPEHPFEWHPYPRERHPHFFIEGLKCRKDALPGMPPWCGLDVCIEEQHRCMRQIGIETVLAECRRVASV